MGPKRKHRSGKDDFEYDPAPKHLQVAHIKNQEKRLIVILEKAQLESVKVRLSCILRISYNYRISILILKVYLFPMTNQEYLYIYNFRNTEISTKLLL